jgi:hypothetical protein
MGVTTDLRRALRDDFEPMAVSRGFKIDRRNLPLSTEFRRHVDGQIQIFCIQWDKYGRPRFIVHFGTCPAEGFAVNGTVHAPDDVLPSWLPDAGTLQPRRGTSTRSWFRQDSTLFQRLLGKPARRGPSEVVDELVALFQELENYWARAAIGPHTRLWRQK